MSASACLAFYGIRFEVTADEVEGLETRTDPRMQVARKAGLGHYWANFGAPDERYLLFIGAKLCVLGPEDEPEVVVPTQELQSLIESTKNRLQAAGLTGEPSLHIQWLEDA